MPRRSLQQKFNQNLRFFSRHALPPHRIFSRRVYRCGSDPVKLLWIDRTTAQPNDLGKLESVGPIRKRVNVKHHIWKKMTFIQGPITPILGSLSQMLFPPANFLSAVSRSTCFWKTQKRDPFLCPVCDFLPLEL